MSPRKAHAQPQHRRWWLAALLVCALLAVAAGRTPGTPRAHADTDEEWINTVVVRADLNDDAEIAALKTCLRAKLAAGVARLDAVGPCFIQATVPSTGEDLIAGLTDPEGDATLKARLTAAQAAVEQILQSLKDRGATQGELDNLRPQLMACMSGWSSLTDDVNEIAKWCRDDVPDFDQSERGHPETVDPLAPVISDLGCPDDITVGQQFDCFPRVVGPTDDMGWGLDGGATTKVSSLQITLTLTNSDPHDLDFAACNTGHCTATVIKIQGSLPAPTGGSTGCPAEANPGQTVDCTPSGWKPVDDSTSYSWTASAGGSSTNITDSYEITFPSDDTKSITVTMTACNGSTVSGSHPKHCTPLTATISRAGPVDSPEGSISCSPASGPASADSVLLVTCTATLTNTDSSTTKTWSSPDAVGQAGEGDTWVVLLDKPGKTYVITLTACNGSKCFTPSFSVTTDAAAPTGSISCTPPSGSAPLQVGCNANLNGTIPFTTLYGWSTTGTPVGAANDQLFIATFDKPGNQTVTLQACNGSACATFSTTVTVNPPPVPPSGTIGCSPATVRTGDSVSCSSSGVSGTITARTWTAPNGTPATGSGESFSTSYNTTGGQTITLQACNGTACATFTATVNVLRKDPTPAPTAVPQKQPITLNGTISEKENDIDCGFSAMPSGGGTISITLTFGSNPGDPIVAVGSFHGSSGGTRSVHCSRGTFTETYQASFGANFNGVVGPGGAISITSTLNITQSSSYTNCKDTSGANTSCPPEATSTSYKVTLLGTINIAPNGQSASGSGSIDMSKSGCSTSGSWQAN